MHAPIKRKAPVKKSRNQEKTTQPEELLDDENKKGEKVAKVAFLGDKNYQKGKHN
jgi:hypothetical protein